MSASGMLHRYWRSMTSADAPLERGFVTRAYVPVQNPDPLYQLVSWCLVMRYAMCVSVCKTTCMACVWEPNGAMGPASRAGGRVAALEHAVASKSPILQYEYPLLSYSYL